MYKTYAKISRILKIGGTSSWSANSLNATNPVVLSAREEPDAFMAFQDVANAIYAIGELQEYTRTGVTTSPKGKWMRLCSR